MSAHRAYMVLVLVASIAFIVSTVGFGTLAKVTVADDSLRHALSERVHYMNAVELLSLLAPFLTLAVIAAVFVRARGVKFGFAVFWFGAALLGALYFIGYTSSEQAMLNHKWTAAALSVGFLPFQSVPVLAVVLIGALVAARRRRTTSDS